MTEGPETAEPGEETATVGRHTFVRAYQLVEGRIVTVWIHGTGSAEPSADELRRLLDAQVALTRS